LASIALAIFVGEALAVGALVVDDGDLLALEVLGQVGAGHQALLVVATHDAEDVLQAALGDLRVGRHRRHRDLRLVVDVGGRDRRARTPVAVHEDDLLVDHRVGHRNGLLRVAGVVADFELQLLAEDAALGVDVGDRHLGALADLVARRGVLTGHRAGDGHQMIGVGVAAGEGQQAEAGRQDVFVHLFPPLLRWSLR
jgi:hypothetical protein